MKRTRARPVKRRGALTSEHLARIDQGLRDIQDSLGPLDALERCGDDCQEQRETLLALQEKLLAYKREYFPTSHVT